MAAFTRLKEELLEALQPDLIVTQELCDVCAVSYKDVQHAARVLDAQDENRFPRAEHARRSPRHHPACWRNDRPAEPPRVRKSRSCAIGWTRTRTRPRPARPRVYAMEWLDPPFSGGHWVPEMVEIAGGEEVLGKAWRKSERITPEQIRAADRKSSC